MGQEPSAAKKPQELVATPAEAVASSDLLVARVIHLSVQAANQFSIQRAQNLGLPHSCYSDGQFVESDMTESDRKEQREPESVVAQP